MRSLRRRAVTTEENPADANPGGYDRLGVDDLLARARARDADPAERAALYADLGSRFADDPPSVPIWYDPAYSAISSRLTRPDTPIDLALPRYAWDAWSWVIAAP